MVIFKQIFQGGFEVRISACGGHGFPVYSHPGHALLSEFGGPGFVAPLVHETGSSDAIKKSGYLSSMERIGGINFNPRVSGGYRPRAASVVHITEEQGRIHGNPVADRWAGAVSQKSLRIQKCDGPTDPRTDGPMDRWTD